MYSLIPITSYISGNYFYTQTKLKRKVLYAAKIKGVEAACHPGDNHNHIKMQLDASSFFFPLYQSVN
jgi:hypothetical protein